MAISRMVNTQEDITPYEHKSFRELLQELRKTALKARDLIEATIRQGQREGMSNEEIKQEIQSIGVPYNTMLEYIPNDMKRPYNRYSSGKSTKSEISTKENTRLVIEDEEPRIPAPTQTIIEPEPTGEIIKIEMDWGHCNFFCNWFKNELKAHADKKDGRYIIEYDIISKEISVDIVEI